MSAPRRMRVGHFPVSTGPGRDGWSHDGILQRRGGVPADIAGGRQAHHPGDAGLAGVVHRAGAGVGTDARVRQQVPVQIQRGRDQSAARHSDHRIALLHLLRDAGHGHRADGAAGRHHRPGHRLLGLPGREFSRRHRSHRPRPDRGGHGDGHELEHDHAPRGAAAGRQDRAAALRQHHDHDAEGFVAGLHHHGGRAGIAGQADRGVHLQECHRVLAGGADVPGDVRAADPAGAASGKRSAAK